MPPISKYILLLLTISTLFACAGPDLEHKQLRAKIFARILALHNELEAYARTHQKSYPLDMSHVVKNPSLTVAKGFCDTDKPWIVVCPVANRALVIPEARKALKGQIIYCPLDCDPCNTYWLLAKDEKGNLINAYDVGNKPGVFALTPTGNDILRQ